MSKVSSKKSLYINNCNFCSNVISSKDTTPLILFPSSFTKVRCFLWCLKGAVRLSPLLGQCALLFCIHPGFHPLESNKCFKCPRTHQPAFCTVHLWLFICLLVMTCCNSGEEGKWLNCMRVKVTVTIRALRESHWWEQGENPVEWSLVCTSVCEGSVSRQRAQACLVLGKTPR